jgi:peroxiredoxin
MDAHGMAMKKCPVCGVSVKVENLERHVGNQHPRAHLEPEQILTEGERQEVRRSAPTSRPAMTRRGKMIAAGVAVVLVVVLVALVFRPNVGLGVGQVAPDFTVATSDGGSFHLYSKRDRPVFLEFMDVDCLFCVNEAQTVLPALYRNYSAQVWFLSIDTDSVGNPDTRDRINAFRTQYQNTWPFGLPDPLITQSYGVDRTPMMYVLDANGVVVKPFVGETPYADLAIALDRALKA